MDRQNYSVLNDCRIPDAWRGNCACGKWLVILVGTQKQDPIACMCQRKYYDNDGNLICDAGSCPAARPQTLNRVGALTKTQDPPPIISLSGYKGSGKDTVTRMICRTLSGIYQIALGDVLRETVRNLYGFTMIQMLDPILKEIVDPVLGLSPRDALIKVGEGLRNVVGQQVWLNAMQIRMRKIARLHTAIGMVPIVLTAMVAVFTLPLGMRHSLIIWTILAIWALLIAGLLCKRWQRKPARFVVSDVRKQAELNWIKESGGETWVIYRSGVNGNGSETESLPDCPDAFDRILYNSGNLITLRDTVRTILNWSAIGIRDGKHRIAGPQDDSTPLPIPVPAQDQDQDQDPGR